ncbi:MFS transporter [Maribellus comscasis]|uniref:MFS transporter n=1 Tax=Maribellus comscasis TaxID=2681766 RepID=A0A6I6K3Z8_9BACT|nr:MFS transporter [Maribellus comscasis]QGY47152.1 MFS transporter [Maribellus comscasis]
MKLKTQLNNFPFSPNKIPFFYGWIILFASTVGVLASAPGQTTGVSTFTDYLIDAIGISRTQLSTAYMVGTIGSSLVLTWAGKMYDKYGARWVGMIVAVALAFILIFLSQSDRIINFFVSDINSGFYIGFAVAVLMILFFMLRFSGQGVLTMVSRNMLMKWFVARRGFVNGISAIFVALGFSVAPLTFDMLIQGTSWRMAWLLMAAFIGIFFVLFVFLFFRDNPEDLDMIPDGEKHANKEHDVIIKPFKQFTLSEAKKTMSFWLFSIPLAMYALYITGFTFHLVSIFENAGLSREKALAVFIPVSVISVALSLGGGWVSDRIKLKYLLYLIFIGEILALVCLANLNGGIFYFGFILGNGIASGLYNVLMAVTWPRFYGRENLGRITGFVMSLIVFASALGPMLLSFSFLKTGNYSIGFYVLALIILAALFLAYKADNPQDNYTNVQDFS